MDGAQTRRAPPRTMADLEPIFAQARAGEPEALRETAVLAALGIGSARDWPRAIDLLEAAARGGSEAAREELALLPTNPLDALKAPPTEMLHTSPLIAKAEGVASPALCDWLMRKAAPRLQTLEVYETPKEVLDETGARSNSGAALSLLESGLPLIALRERISRLVGLPMEGFETSNVLHYDVGETFSPHYDTFLPEQMRTEPDAARYGHRLFTALVYLNTEYEGGETAFPLLKWSHRGGKGNALIWRNVTTNVELDRNTLHAGSPPTSGEKWVLSQWIRGKRMPLAL